MAGTVSAEEIIDPSVEYKDDVLGLITFFLFFVGYISMGAAFVFFMAERNSVAPQYRTTMTISALIVGIAAFHYYYMRGCLLYTSPSPRDRTRSRMPSSA